MRTDYFFRGRISRLLGLLLFILPASCSLFRPEDRGEILQGSFMWAERHRSYRLYVPPTYDKNQASPLVISFHGAGGSARDMQEGISFDDEADKRAYLTVYPNSRVGSWAIGCNCTEADRLEIDDLGFTRALIDTISASYSVDAHRIYAMGFSLGSMFVHRLACESADRFAALATIAGTMPISFSQTCQPARHVPMLVMHGTEDPLVAWDGEPGLVSVQETVTKWAELNDCPSQPVTEEENLDDGMKLEHHAYAPCAAGTAVHLYAIIGGSHVWPEEYMQANRKIADYFDQHHHSTAGH